MISGIRASAAALRPAALAQELIANNLANATTPGFRQNRIGFQTIALPGPAGSASQPDDMAPELITTLDPRPGAYEVTDRPFDLAIQGDGYFVVQSAEGERYTRAGNFTLNSDGILVTAAGDPLLCEGGTVTLSQVADLRIAPNGELMDGAQSLGRLRVVVFPEQTVLTRAGGGLFTAAEEPTAATEARVLQGVLEGPNVEPLQALIEMVTLLRHFEMNQKALQAQDESLGALLASVRA